MKKALAIAVSLLVVPSILHAQKVRVFPDNLYYGELPRKLYVEIDWMAKTGSGAHSHQPSATVINGIKAAFAAEGYDLTIDLSNEVPHVDVINIPNGYNVSTAPDVAAIANTYFNNKNDPRYFYSLWCHNYALNGVNNGSSGLADLPGRTHLVSLGSFLPNYGSTSERIGTFIHEFGHNLNQRHGGASGLPNYNPNYISVMNYRYQLSGVASSAVAYGLATATSLQGINTFGYSHGTLDALNENSLNETLGIGLGTTVDWNCDLDKVDTSVQRDLTQGSNWCATTPPQTDYTILSDYDNWASVDAHVDGGAGKGLAEHMDKLPDSTPEVCVTAEEHEKHLAELSPEKRAILEAEDFADKTAGGIVSPTVFYVHNHGTSNLNVTNITPQASAPWITAILPTSFTVVPGSYQAVAVTVDNGAAPVGPNATKLDITSNDPSGAYSKGVFIHTNGIPASAKQWELYE